MNKSLFIRSVEDKINFLDLWQETFKVGTEHKKERFKDDKVEIDFWKEYSKGFDKIPNLYEYAPHIFDRLLRLTGKNKKLLEFGCGTGKFTIPMAKYSKNIIGVDQSKEMLDILKEKIDKNNFHNISIMNSKIEDLEEVKVNSIYCVNAFYRVQNPRKLFEKLMNFADEKIILVWTMQRSIYDDILNSTDIKGIDRNQEYIFIINILYEMGIDPSMMMETAYKNIEVEDINKNLNELLDYSKKYHLNYNYLEDKFRENLFTKDEKLYFKSKQRVAIIYFDTK